MSLIAQWCHGEGLMVAVFSQDFPDPSGGSSDDRDCLCWWGFACSDRIEEMIGHFGVTGFCVGESKPIRRDKVLGFRCEFVATENHWRTKSLYLRTQAFARPHCAA